jgi:hypothetical protein
MTTRFLAGQHLHPPSTGERYLLFAGTQPPPSGTLGDPLDTFTSEDVARRAFRDLRLRMSSPTSWAQLAVVDDRHGLKPMCWFGIDAAPERRAALQRKPPSITTSASQVTTSAPHRPRRVVGLVVATLTLLSDVPVIAIGSTGLIKVWATLTVLACALIIVLVTGVQKDATR